MTAAATKRRSRRRAKHRVRLEQSRPVFRDKPSVTLFCDASYSHHDRSGGWGIWLKADGRQAYVNGGPFVGLLPSSVEAEVRAIANGLALGRSKGLIADGACVMIQSDCQPALAWILGAVKTACHRPAQTTDAVPITMPLRTSPGMRASAGLQTVVRIALEAQLKLVVRHVRGHTRRQDGRHGVNRLVDGLAGTYRPKEARK